MEGIMWEGLGESVLILVVLVPLLFIFLCTQDYFLRPLNETSYKLVKRAVGRMPETEFNQVLLRKVERQVRFKPLRLTNDEVDAIMPYMYDFDLKEDMIENRPFRIAREELLSFKNHNATKKK